MSRIFTGGICSSAGADRGRTGAGRSDWLRVVSLLQGLPRSTRAGNFTSETKGRRWSGRTGPT